MAPAKVTDAFQATKRGRVTATRGKIISKTQTSKIVGAYRDPTPLWPWLPAVTKISRNKMT